MSRNQTGRVLRLGLVALVVLVGFVPASLAITQCDTDPNAVDFEATVNPDLLNMLLMSLGQIRIQVGSTPVSFRGLCVNHNFIAIAGADVFLPLNEAMFAVTPSLGFLQVDLNIPGPFVFGLGLTNYSSSNCSSTCVIEIPYIGEIFDGCAVESAVVEAAVEGTGVTVAWDDVFMTQIADTCVLGDCTAVHPLASTNATLTSFDIDATGIGSCEICSLFPDELQFLCPFGSFDPCQGIDPLLEEIFRPLLEGEIADAFVDEDGNGLLINVFRNQIVRDFGCFDIPEVRDCKRGRSNLDSRILNGAFYVLPLGVVAGLALRHRRRKKH